MATESARIGVFWTGTGMREDHAMGAVFGVQAVATCTVLVGVPSHPRWTSALPDAVPPVNVPSR